MHYFDHDFLLTTHRFFLLLQRIGKFASINEKRVLPSVLYKLSNTPY